MEATTPPIRSVITAAASRARSTSSGRRLGVIRVPTRDLEAGHDRGALSKTGTAMAFTAGSCSPKAVAKPRCGREPVPRAAVHADDRVRCVGREADLREAETSRSGRLASRTLPAVACREKLRPVRSRPMPEDRNMRSSGRCHFEGFEGGGLADRAGKRFEFGHGDGSEVNDFSA